MFSSFFPLPLRFGFCNFSSVLVAGSSITGCSSFCSCGSAFENSFCSDFRILFKESSNRSLEVFVSGYLDELKPKKRKVSKETSKKDEKVETKKKTTKTSKVKEDKKVSKKKTTTKKKTK